MYKLISANGILSDDYDLRFDVEREENLKPVDKIVAESWVKDIDYTITIEKKEK